MYPPSVVLLLLLAGCSVMGHERVEGWPELAIVEHYAPHGEMQDRCARHVGFGMVPMACAEFHFARRECHIWFSSDSPPAQFIVKHERLHCQGFDHVGSSHMRNLLQPRR